MAETIALRVLLERMAPWTMALSKAGFNIVDDDANADLVIWDGTGEVSAHTSRILEIDTGLDYAPERMIARASRQLARVTCGSLVDPVTGLMNRSAALARIDNEVELSSRIMKPFAIAIVDPDNFEGLSAGHGQGVTDQILDSFGAYLLSQLRKIDGVARWGSEELALIMPATYPTQATTVIARLQDRLGTSSATKVSSFSAGVAAFPIDADSAEQLTALAEERLAGAKRKGEGRIVMV